MEQEFSSEIESIARLIARSTHAVAFTGAGVSTPSGIPDFRSAGTGLWQQDNPMLVASASTFFHHPERFFNWLRPLLASSLKAHPNPAHLALAELEQLGFIKAIITQNIDGLHQRAGSTSVIELHGSMQRFFCPGCQRLILPPDDAITAILAGEMPRCDQCGAVIKPDITLFEEALPADAWENAENEVYLCDLMLIVGSSLEVAPASSLPALAHRNGAALVITNFSPTFLDRHAQVVLNMDVAGCLPRIVERLKKMK